MEWRAVVHDTDVPPEGLAVSGELAETFDRKLVEIRDLLRVGESYPATRPTVQPNTTLAVAGYSTVTGVDADRLRAAVFDALWIKGLDIGDASVLGELGCPTGPPSVTMQWWHDQWLGFDRPMVPIVVFPEGIGVKRLRCLEVTCRTRRR